MIFQSWAVVLVERQALGRSYDGTMERQYKSQALVLLRYTTSTFIIFRANARVKTRQRLNDRVLDDVAYDIDSEMIVPLFMDEVDISGVDWVVELQPQEVAK